ncbi:hypothetical protein ACFL1R_00075 [Candidatus Latescibacterota bacterium]
MKTAFPQVHKITAWIALFAGLLTCTGQAGEFVICLGEDGHIAIEAVVNRQCECNREVNIPERLYVSLQDEVVSSHHHECDHFDIPIFMNDTGEFITQVKYIVTHNQITSLFDSTFINTYFDEIIQEVLIIEPPPDINPVLVSILTVISLS